MTAPTQPVVTSEAASQETPSSRIIVRLTITDFDCAADEITSTLGIAPTKTWRRGEVVHPRAKNVHHQNGWSLQAPCDPQTASLEDQVRALLQLLLPHVPFFAALPANAEVELSCFIYAVEHRPVIHFSPEVVRQLAQLGASLDVDCYDLTE